MIIVIYKLTCIVNNKNYIGITSNLQHRLNVHFGCYKNTLLSRAIKKHGKDNFIVNIIEQVNSWQEACLKEQIYIQLYNSFMPIGYNMSLGGEGQLGYKHNEITKKKISEGHKGKAVGKDNPMFGKVGANKGKKWSKESKEKLSESCKGRTPWNKGKKCPQLTGEKNPFYGKYHTEKTKQMMSDKKKNTKWSNETRIKILKSRENCQLGEKHSQAKLKNKDILVIKNLYQNKMKQKEIAVIYNITQPQVSNIIRNKSWK